MEDLLKAIKINLIERRPKDAWFDFSLRKVMEGTVSYFRVKDFVSANWLFKLCKDGELGKVVVKAIKCPAGKPYFSLEGDSMVFQRSMQKGFLYDLISAPQIGEGDRIRRSRISEIDEVPKPIRDHFKIVTHSEATGKDTPLANLLVTLTPEEDLRSLLHLFILERIWPLAPQSPEEAYTQVGLEAGKRRKSAPPVNRKVLNAIRKAQKASITEVFKIVKLKGGEEEYRKVLDELATAGKISYPEVGYVKV